MRYVNSIDLIGAAMSVGPLSMDMLCDMIFVVYANRCEWDIFAIEM